MSDDGSDGRDEGIDRVMMGESLFSARVTFVVKRLPRGWRGIGEDIKRLYFAAGYPPPHHHNCWGGVIHGLVRAGFITPIQGWGHTSLPVSHRRKSVEYIR
jgi:hypothetical protein